MITYTYLCSNCGEFDVERSIRSPALTACPHCSGQVEPIIYGGVHCSVIGEATTVGQLAERNSQKIGKTKLEELEALKQNNKPKFTTGLTVDKYKKICKMSPEKKIRYIMEGR